MIEAQPSLGNVLANYDHALAARRGAVLADRCEVYEEREGVAVLPPPLHDRDFGIERAEQAPDLGANVIVGGALLRQEIDLRVIERGIRSHGAGSFGRAAGRA